MGLLFPIYGKMKNVPNHQPEIDLHQKPYFKSSIPNWNRTQTSTACPKK